MYSNKDVKKTGKLSLRVCFKLLKQKYKLFSFVLQITQHLVIFSFNKSVVSNVLFAKLSKT